MTNFEIPQNYFKTHECPGHIFSQKTMLSSHMEMHMRICMLCFYMEGVSGWVDEEFVKDSF
jgi:hypothetical protein